MPTALAFCLTLVSAASIVSEPLASSRVGVWVEAAPATLYVAKCHVRTYRGVLGVYANTYYIQSQGMFRDQIPSPSAQCVFGKVKGPGPVTLHLWNGADHSATVLDPGRWRRVEVW